MFGGWGLDPCTDNFFVLDGNRNVNNNFLGNSKIVAIFFAGAGDSTFCAGSDFMRMSMKIRPDEATRLTCKTRPSGRQGLYAYGNMVGPEHDPRDGNRDGHQSDGCRKPKPGREWRSRRAWRADDAGQQVAASTYETYARSISWKRTRAENAWDGGNAERGEENSAWVSARWRVTREAALRVTRQIVEALAAGTWSHAKSWKSSQGSPHPNFASAAESSRADRRAVYRGSAWRVCRRCPLLNRTRRSQSVGGLQQAARDTLSLTQKVGVVHKRLSQPVAEISPCVN